MTESSDRSVVIVGAGLSGLIAARELLATGRHVQVIDKGRGVGGRLATRRIGGAKLDHGAQFFTVRGDNFQSFIELAIESGVVATWCHGFDSDDGYPRYFCPEGMTALAKWLAEQVRMAGAAISLGERVAHIAVVDGGWQLRLDSGTDVRADDLIVTTPVPQALELLSKGDVEVDSEHRAALEAIEYKPTIAALVTLDAAPNIAPPGGVQQTEDNIFTFIADNQQKGISAEPAVTFHLNGSLSKARWDDDPELVLADVLIEAAPWLGDTQVLEAQLKKWKYAGPLQPHPARCVIAADSPGALILAGDAFGGPKVEGAFNSGLAAARALLDRN